MAFLGKGKKQDVQNLAQELGITISPEMNRLQLKIAITSDPDYDEEFVRVTFETLVAERKSAEEKEKENQDREKERQDREKERQDREKERQKERQDREKENERQHQLRIAEIKKQYQLRPAELEKQDREKHKPREHNLKVKELKLKFELEEVKLAIEGGGNTELSVSSKSQSVVENSGPFGTVKTKAAVCESELKQSRYLLDNRAAALKKEKTGYDFFPVESVHAVQTGVQARELSKQSADREIAEKCAETVAESREEGAEELSMHSEPGEEISIPNVEVELPELALLEIDRDDFIRTFPSSPSTPVESVHAVQTGVQEREIYKQDEDREIAEKCTETVAESREEGAEELSINSEPNEEISIPNVETDSPELALLEIDREDFIRTFPLSPNTPADACMPKLNEGDQVRVMNGGDVVGLTHDQIVKLRADRDISPYDTTRVTLAGSSSGGYINANHVQMGIPISGIVNRYIASRGPLLNTTVDFWLRIWEQQSTLIVMVTILMEGGQSKYHKCWPKLYGVLDLRLLRITCIKEQESSYFAVREFTLINSGNNEERHITHMKYTA